jgi:hypothetical protein
MADAQRLVHSRGGQKKVDFYLLLHALGTFPPDAPATIRAFGIAQGQVTVEELVDRYQLQCKPVRDLLVDYLKERQPALDYASLDSISRSLAGLFWARIEALSPGIDTLRLPPDVARAWKEDVQTRALYLDIAQWAMEEPERWVQWAVPSPVSDAEIGWAKERRRRRGPDGPADPRAAARPARPHPNRRRPEERDRPPPPGRHDDTARRDHRGHRRDPAQGRDAHGQRQARVGRGRRHRQAPQSVL